MRLLFALVDNRWYMGKIASESGGWVLQDPAIVDFLTVPAASNIGGMSLLSMANVQLLGPDELRIPTGSVRAWSIEELSANGGDSPSKPAALYEQALKAKQSLRTIIT